MMKRQLAAFIFDLDGVLTDTSEYHYLAWKRLADEEYIDFDRRTNEKLRGVSRRESLLILLGGLQVEEQKMQEMMERKNGYYVDYISKITPDSLYPGAVDLLKALRARGLKVGLASASKNAEVVVRALNIDILLDAVSDGHSVERTKPAPDLFLHSARALNVDPELCAVVEDAEAGVEAALAANMTAIGIGPEERVGKAHFVYDSVADIDLSRILHQ